MIDESAADLNLNNPYKSSIWLLRANRYLHFAWSGENDSITNAKKHLASLGGNAKGAKYKPLKEFVIEQVKLKNYPSRRNAAFALAPEVIKKAKDLGLNLSEQQAPLTIAGWLKKQGLPANI